MSNIVDTYRNIFNSIERTRDDTEVFKLSELAFLILGDIGAPFHSDEIKRALRGLRENVISRYQDVLDDVTEQELENQAQQVSDGLLSRLDELDKSNDGVELGALNKELAEVNASLLFMQPNSGEFKVLAKTRQAVVERIGGINKIYDGDGDGPPTRPITPLTNNPMSH